MVDIKNQKAKQRKGKQYRNALNLPVFLVFLSFELLPQIDFVREIDPRVFRASKQRQHAVVGCRFNEMPVIPM